MKEQGKSIITTRELKKGMVVEWYNWWQSWDDLLVDDTGVAKIKMFLIKKLDEDLEVGYSTWRCFCIEHSSISSLNGKVFRNFHFASSDKMLLVCAERQVVVEVAVEEEGGQ